MSNDAEMMKVTSKIRATYDAGHCTLEEALEQAYRYGRISGLHAGIESIESIFPPEPDSRKVRAARDEARRYYDDREYRETMPWSEQPS